MRVSVTVRVQCEGEDSVGGSEPLTIINDRVNVCERLSEYGVSENNGMSNIVARAPHHHKRYSKCVRE